MKRYVYIVVRKDMKSEYLAPQLCHAALEAGYTFNRPEVTTHLVLLEVYNKVELDMVAVALEEERIRFESFYEGFGKMGHTALATEPIEKPTGGVLCGIPLFKF